MMQQISIRYFRKKYNSSPAFSYAQPFFGRWTPNFSSYCHVKLKREFKFVWNNGLLIKNHLFYLSMIMQKQALINVYRRQTKVRDKKRKCNDSIILFSRALSSACASGCGLSCNERSYQFNIKWNNLRRRYAFCKLIHHTLDFTYQYWNFQKLFQRQK